MHSSSKRLTREMRLEALEHAEAMSARAESNCGIEGLETVAEYSRAIRRCPGHFTLRQRELAHEAMLATYFRAIGRA
jgi:hypothetical protein